MSKSLPDIREQARGRWPSILAALGVDERSLSGKNVPCPIEGAGKDRFRFDDKDGRGTFICTHCGAGEGVNLVMRLRGLEFKDAAKLIREILPSAPEVKRAKERTTEQKEASLVRMWNGAEPIAEGDAVDKYLQARGIHARSPSLRCGVLPYYEDGKKRGEYRAMVAKIATVEAKVASLHITYLTAEGTKAEVGSPKKIMQAIRPVMGSAVRLHSAGAVLGVAEGIETALSVHEMFSVPVWATISADGMAGFVWPSTVERLIIFADNDKNYAGHKAAYTLAFRAAAKQVAVEVRFPELLGMDWNDAWRDHIRTDRRAA